MTRLDGKRVLVLEDEPLVFRMVSRLLDSLGAHALGPVATVADGLRRVEEGDFDAALLDMNLRGEPALPVAVALRARAVPFVYVTGYSKRANAYPPAPSLTKPFRRAQLAAALAACLAEADATDPDHTTTAAP